jgi:hypothetical protein
MLELSLLAESASSASVPGWYPFPLVSRIDCSERMRFWRIFFVQGKPE